jgi:hypothetical protein
MPSFWQFWSAAEGKDRPTQVRLFEDLVVRAHPEAYTPAVIGLDVSGLSPDEALARRFDRVFDDVQRAIPAMRALSPQMPEKVAGFERDFRGVFPDFRLTGTIYFMVSLGGFDGGTREIGGKQVLLFGLDVIAGMHAPDANLAPFFEHELFHVYHEGMHPRAPDGLWWSLWEEGLAVHVSKTLNPTATNAEIELADPLTARANAVLPQLAHELRQKMDSTSDQAYGDFFLGHGKRTDIPARSGYYVGMLVAEHLERTRSLAQLVKMEGQPLHRAIEGALEDIEQGR